MAKNYTFDPISTCRSLNISRLTKQLFRYRYGFKNSYLERTCINNDRKRNFLFKQMRGSNFEIIALQKTHATNDPSEISAEEWTGDSVWDNKSNISCGLAR